LHLELEAPDSTNCKQKFVLFEASGFELKLSAMQGKNRIQGRRQLNRIQLLRPSAMHGKNRIQGGTQLNTQASGNARQEKE